MKFLSVMLLLSLLAGCQSSVRREPSALAFPLDGGTLTLSKEIDTKFQEVLAACATVSDQLQGKTDKSRKTVVTIATIGIIAGSIIVPALAAKATVSKSAIAAWGGVAGAANAGQSLLTQTGMSHVSLSDNYRAFSAQFNKDVDAFLGSTSEQEAYRKLYAMEAHCRIAPIAAVSPVGGGAGGN